MSFDAKTAANAIGHVTAAILLFEADTAIFSLTYEDNYTPVLAVRLYDCDQDDIAYFVSYISNAAGYQCVQEGASVMHLAENYVDIVVRIDAGKFGHCACGGCADNHITCGE